MLSRGELDPEIVERDHRAHLGASAHDLQGEEGSGHRHEQTDAAGDRDLPSRIQRAPDGQGAG